MTSNMGSHIIQEKFKGMNEGNEVEILDGARQSVIDLLKQNIRPEFLNRIDEIIMFKPLQRKEINDIVRIQVNGLIKKLVSNGIKLEVSPEAIDFLADAGYEPEYGARPLKRVVQKLVLNQLSKDILAGKVNRDSEIEITKEGNGLKFINKTS